MVNAKRKQDDQLVPDQTQDTTTEDPNNIIMEDQTRTTLTNQRTQTRFSSPNRRETRKKVPLVLPKTLYDIVCLRRVYMLYKYSGIYTVVCSLYHKY